MTGKGVAAKESHERGSIRPKALVKRFQGGFPTHRLSDEDDDKVNRVIETKPGAGKPRPLLDGIQNAKLSKDMGKNGHLKDRGQPLEDTGKVVRGKQKTVTDGPYTESKDLVGGYTLVEAKDLAQAAELSKGCPIFDTDGLVEVRPVMEM